MEHHKWRRISDANTDHVNKWRCSACGSVATCMNKPKTKRQYRNVNVGMTCTLEMIRRIHES